MNVSDEPPKSSAPTPADVDMLDWKRADCLGCGRRIVRARDGWAEIGGTRSGSYLITWGTEPLLARATDPEGAPDEPLVLLGVVHHDCLPTARARLEAGTVAMPADLPMLKVEQGDEVPDPGYSLHLPSQADACPFCDGATDLTQEHVWPEWYSRKLRSDGAIPVGDNVRRGRIDLTVPVCNVCNNTWMSVLENDASSVLRRMMNAASGDRSTFRISLDEQALLASWAVLKAYLLDAMAQPIVPRGFLHEFALRRVPNESTLLWVGEYTPNVAAQSERRALDFLSRVGPTRNSPNGFATTFTILNVLFQIVGHFNGGPAVMSGARPQYESALLPIWPPTTAQLAWPPTVGFTPESWDDLTASIGGAQTE